MGKDIKLTGKSSSIFNMYLLEKVLPELKGGNFDIEFVDFVNDFHDLPESMQWGVLVDFFESVDILISCWIDDYKGYHLEVKLKKSYVDKWYIYYEDMSFDLLDEARLHLIEKANEILNKKLEE